MTAASHALNFQIQLQSNHPIYSSKVVKFYTECRTIIMNYLFIYLFTFQLLDCLSLVVVCNLQEIINGILSQSKGVSLVKRKLKKVMSHLFPQAFCKIIIIVLIAHKLIKISYATHIFIFHFKYFSQYNSIIMYDTKRRTRSVKSQFYKG